MASNDPIPPGVPSNETATQAPVHRVMAADTLYFQLNASPALLVLIPASHHLLAHARTMAAEEKHQFAVLFAHAACELHTEGELIRLLAPRKDRDLVELVLPGETEVKGLDKGRIQSLYLKLTGDNPTQATWWGAWKASRKDRHAVAHKGEQMTAQQSAAALDACDKYIKHVTEKVEALLRKVAESTGATSTDSPGTTRTPSR
jgi:hypothetical protein